MILPFLAIALNACSQTPSKLYPEAKPDAYWKKKLSPEAYDILVKRGTGKPLFNSDTKYDLQTGWPTFFKPIDPKSIKIVRDTSDGMDRDEVVEASTGLHLGHVFDDCPAPTGKRYCMDSYAFKFIPAK